MPISLKCKGCQSTLRVPETYAGKKVKCPKCQFSLVVPEAEEDEVVADIVSEEPEERVADAPLKKRKPAPRIRDEDEEEDDRRESVREGRKRGRDFDDEDRGRAKGRRRRDEDEEEDEDRGRSSRGYKPCPRCGAEDPKKVVWTWWGSFYGPAMFSHVRCLDCGHCYNGRSGGSNAIPATIFFLVPLLGILGIIGAIFYMLISRGVLKF